MQSNVTDSNAIYKNFTSTRLDNAKQRQCHGGFSSSCSANYSYLSLYNYTVKDVYDNQLHYLLLFIVEYTIPFPLLLYQTKLPSERGPAHHDIWWHIL